jgi:hypothetical protein
MFVDCVELVWFLLPRWLQAALAIMFIPIALAIDTVAFCLVRATPMSICSAELAAAAVLASASLFWVAYSFVKGGFFVVVVVVVEKILSALTADLFPSVVLMSFQIDLSASLTCNLMNSLLATGLAILSLLASFGMIVLYLCRIIAAAPLLTLLCATHIYVFK